MLSSKGKATKKLFMFKSLRLLNFIPQKCVQIEDVFHLLETQRE